MKELSIEDKAKAYDEALERARQIHNEHKAQPFDVMLKVFPELKESEDEKIRKQLLKHLREVASGKSLELSTTDYERWATWVAKQGEHANFLSKIQAGDKVTRNEDGVLVNLSQLNRVAKKDEKQGEQKPADKVEPNDYSRIDPYFFKPVDKVEPKFKIGDKIKLAREPKYPAREIVAIQDDAYYFDEVVHLPFSRQDEWELVEKNPAWSEEDETALGDALWCCKQAASIAKDENDMGNIWYAEKWLKSLRPQNTWKPSDEQFNNTSCTHLSKEEAESKVWKQ